MITLPQKNYNAVEGELGMAVYLQLSIGSKAGFQIILFPGGAQGISETKRFLASQLINSIRNKVSALN